MSQQRPAAMTAAVWLTAGLIVLAVVAAVLSVVFGDELRDAWRSGQVDDSAIVPPSIVPVVVVMLAVFAMLTFVLLEFLRARHGWARPAITVLVAALALATLATLRVRPPALFVVLSVVSLMLDVAVVVALWHRDTTAYLRDAEVAEA